MRDLSADPIPELPGRASDSHKGDFGRAMIVGGSRGMAGAVAFVTIGAYAYVGAMTRMHRDVPPYMIVEGHDSRVRGVNVIGLDRAGINGEDAEALRNAIEIAEVAQLTENFSITASIGVAGFRPADSIDSLLRRADAALYRAKQNGRNLVVHSRDGDQDPPKGERITRQRASV